MATPGIQTLTSLSGTEQVTSIDPGGAVSAQASTKLIASLFGQSVYVDSLWTTQSVTASSYTLSGARTATGLVMTGTFSTLTISLPPNPVQGQVSGFSIDHNVTALTVTGSNAAPIDGLVTSGTTGSFTYIYNAADNKWYQYV